MILKYIFPFIISFLLILSGCIFNQNPENATPGIFEENSLPDTEKVKQIFYNMYLPTEMSRLFEKTGTNFNPKILNNADDFTRYDENSKIALNIGVYGVDLSYCRIFGQNSATAKYFSSVQVLYEKLGIPSGYFENLLQGLEKYYNDKDSLAKFAGEVYESADYYLRENDENATAALVIAGGWVEALYLGCKIAEYNPDNIEIKERVAAQKYSLNSLISLLGNYQENIEIAKYILMLKGLKKTFDKFDIYYHHGDVKVDTINKFISATDYDLSFSGEILEEIGSIIGEIRSDIVN